MQSRRGPITVVKLGGSLASSDDLAGWLDVLCRSRAGVVVVPGGGPFADAVRDQQARLGFDDGVAHQLAILAMEQFGRVLARLRPGLSAAASKSAIRRALAEGRVPIWMPARMTAGRAEIPESWDVTSDSLALWLAIQLHARRVILIKAADPPSQATTAVELAQHGLIDTAFPHVLAGFSGDVWYAGPLHRDRLAVALDGDAEPGIRIRPAPA